MCNDVDCNVFIVMIFYFFEVKGSNSWLLFWFCWILSVIVLIILFVGIIFNNFVDCELLIG